MKSLNQDYIVNVTNEVVMFNEKFKEAALIEYEKFRNTVESLGDNTDDLTKEYG